MLANVLGVPASELSAKAIEELASLGRSEDQYLEFKEQLPERDRDALQRIAQAVVGMANSAGGLIVFGVAEKDGVATHAQPVDISDRADALPKSLSSRIQPRVDGLRWHHIPKDSPDRGYLVLEVPPSPLRPHFIVDGASLAATKRVNRDSVPLSEADVERFYRERWELRARAEVDQEQLLNHVVADNRPSFYLGAAQSFVTGRVFTRCTEAVDKVNSDLMRSGLQMIFGGRPVFSGRPKIGFRRVEISEYGQHAGRGMHNWHVVTDRGSYLFVRPAWSIELLKQQSGVRLPETGAQWYVVPEFILEAVLCSMVALRTVAEAFSIPGDFSLRIGLRVPDRLLLDPVNFQGFDERPLLMHSVVYEGGVDVDELSNPSKWIHFARQAVIDLLSAFGIDGGLFVTEAGRLDQRYVDRSVMMWGQRHGIA